MSAGLRAISASRFFAVGIFVAESWRIYADSETPMKRKQTEDCMPALTSSPRQTPQGSFSCKRARHAMSASAVAPCIAITQLPSDPFLGSSHPPGLVHPQELPSFMDFSLKFSASPPWRQQQQQQQLSTASMQTSPHAPVGMPRSTCCGWVPTQPPTDEDIMLLFQEDCDMDCPPGHQTRRQPDTALTWNNQETPLRRVPAATSEQAATLPAARRLFMEQAVRPLQPPPPAAPILSAPAAIAALQAQADSLGPPIAGPADQPPSSTVAHLKPMHCPSGQDLMCTPDEIPQELLDLCNDPMVSEYMGWTSPTAAGLKPVKAIKKRGKPRKTPRPAEHLPATQLPTQLQPVGPPPALRQDPQVRQDKRKSPCSLSMVLELLEAGDEVQGSPAAEPCPSNFSGMCSTMHQVCLGSIHLNQKMTFCRLMQVLVKHPAT